MRKIKVLHCIETIGSGGVERRRLSIIKGLDSNLFEHKIICTKAINNLPNVFKELGVEIIEIGQFSYPVQFSKIKATLEVVRRFQPDIIHGAIFEGISMATVAGTIGKVPIRIAEETSFPSSRSKKATYLLRVLLSFADYVVAVSPGVHSYLLKEAGVAQAKLRLINNGIDAQRKVSDQEATKLREILGINNSDFVIGSVGRIYDHIKRFSDILRAVKILNRHDVKIVIVGEGPDTELLKQLAIQLNLENNLIMPGFQSDTAPFYSIMDVFAIVSQSEGFGLAAVEAMSHTLPVIATRVGGLEYIIKDNITGYLIDPNSPEQLASSIEKLISNPLLIQQMGTLGSERALNNFSAERYVKDVERLYCDALEEKRINK